MNVVVSLISAILAGGGWFASGPATTGRADLEPLRRNGAVAVLSDHYRAVSAVDPRTGRSVQIVHCPARCDFIDSFSWSPDGTRLAYDVVPCVGACNADEPTRGLYVKAAGRPPLHLTSENNFFVWSPDGSQLAVGLPSPGGTDLAIVDPATGARRVLARVSGELLPPAWVNGGRALVYAEVTASALDVARVDVAGGRAITIRRFASNQGAAAATPVVVGSPDGTRVVVSVFNAGVWIVYVMGADGSHPRIIARNPNRQFAATAAWSPNGSAVAVGFCFRRRGVHHAEIRVVSADGRVLRRLVDSVERHGFNLAWSPDGSRIVFTLAAPAWQVVRSTGGVARPIPALRALGWLQVSPVRDTPGA